MCMSCGCGEPNADHGNPDHITQAQMERAAAAAGITLQQAADNIRQSAQAQSGSSAASSGAQDTGSISSHGGTQGSGSVPGEGTRQEHGIRS